MGGSVYTRQQHRDLAGGLATQSYKNYSLERARLEAQKLVAANCNADSMHGDGDLGKQRSEGFDKRGSDGGSKNRSGGGNANFRERSANRFGSAGRASDSGDSSIGFSKPVGLSKPAGLTPIKRPAGS